MNHTNIPACFFPTTVLFLDDSQGYLNSLRLMLDEDLSYRLFDSPNEALQVVKAQKNEEVLSKKVLVVDDNEFDVPNGAHTLHLNLSAIYHESYNLNRYDEISVAVVDYAMPQMNGVDFFKEIKHLPIKKVMLTGQADETVAVDAFNEGIIDKFIVKSHPDVSELLNQTIHKLQLDYFLAGTESIIKSLTPETMCCLRDPFFVEFFNGVCRDNDIVEYYLASTPGTFLLLDIEGNASWLIVKTKSDMQIYKELATEYGAPQDVIEDINNTRKIPHFWDAKHFYNVSGRAWESFVLPCQRLEGQKFVYYYSLIKNIAASGLNIDKVVSYRDYLQSANEVA